MTDRRPTQYAAGSLVASAFVAPYGELLDV